MWKFITTHVFALMTRALLQKLHASFTAVESKVFENHYKINSGKSNTRVPFIHIEADEKLPSCRRIVHEGVHGEKRSLLKMQ